MIKNNFRYIVPVILLMIVGLLLSPSVSDAQPNEPTGEVDAPIDGGVSLLVAAGVGYGIKKYRDSKKKKDSMVL